VADVLTFFFDKVAFPVLSGAGGVGLTVWKTSKSIAARVTLLEATWKQFHENDHPREKGEVAAALATLKADIEKELNAIHLDDRRSMRERLDARRLQANMSDRIAQLEMRLGNCERSVNTLNDQFQTFAREQNDQWQVMTRALGQLEGYIKGISGKNSSGTFSPMK
jgi:uncharacterized coiled-coil protein SlyX